MKTIEKKIDLGKTKLRYFKTGKENRLLINFGRYKKGDIDTVTLYCSIEDNTKSYTEIWMDKQGKRCIGVEIMWDDK